MSCQGHLINGMVICILSVLFQNLLALAVAVLARPIAKLRV